MAHNPYDEPPTASDAPPAIEAIDPGAQPRAQGPDNGPEVAGDLTRTLVAFGGASVLVGGVLAAVSDRPGPRAFGQQSAMWGAINLAIAGFGTWRARSRPAQAAELRRTLLVNAALDLGYIAAGAHVAHHRVTFGGRLAPEAARGHGAAIVVQGAGLMTLDLHHARRLQA